MRSEVTEFFDGQTVFVTGGLGFVGQSLIECILRKTRVQAVYMLIRSKRNKTAQQRFQKFINEDVFDRVRAADPGFGDRLRIVEGNISEEGLGLSEEQLGDIVHNVNIVIHAAAYTSFVQSLRSAINTNVLGTYRVIQLCKKLDHLKVFVYISTTYSNVVSLDGSIEEKVYPNGMDYEKLLAMTTMEESVDKILTPKLIHPWKNVYVFSKAMAEHLVNTEKGNLPFAIFRPPVVICSVGEPVTAWFDSSDQSLIQFFRVFYLGLVQVIYFRSESLINIAPVDFCSNATMAIAWNTSHNRCCQSVETPVYNLSPHEKNRITFVDIFEMGTRQATRRPPNKIVLCYSILLTASWNLFLLLNFLLHTLPLVFVQLWANRVMGRNLRMIQMMCRFHLFLSVYSFFLKGLIDFKSDKMWELWDSLSKADKEAYNFNMIDMDWNRLSEIVIEALKTRLLNEDLDDCEEGKYRLKWLFRIHFLVKTALYICLAAIVFCASSRLVDIVLPCLLSYK